MSRFYEKWKKFNIIFGNDIIDVLHKIGDREYEILLNRLGFCVFFAIFLYIDSFYTHAESQIILN